jgi:glycogen debranching enzyme
MLQKSTPLIITNVVARAKRAKIVRSFPKYPILHQREVGEKTTDLKDQLPNYIDGELTDDEIVAHIHIPKPETPDHDLTAEEVVMKAAGAAIPEEIGYNGPTIASINPNESAEESRYGRQHGRDDIYAALDVADVYPQLMYAVADSLADSQGQRNEEYVPGQPFGFEKIGGIILVNNDPEDPLAKKFETYKEWKPRNYASADATPLYITLLRKLEQIEPGYLSDSNPKMHRAFSLATKWLIDRTSENPEGLVEYRNPIPSGGGMRHQGWMDSADALVHENGDWIDSRYGVASIDVQSKAYEALRIAANINRKYGKQELADELDKRADSIREFVIENGWVDDSKGGYFAAGWERQADGSLKRINLKTIDMASPLMGTMLKGDDPRFKPLIHKAIRSIHQPDMKTRWGLRARSNLEISYGHLWYHCAVWPDKTGRVAAAMSNHGFYGLDRNLGNRCSRVFSVTGVFPEHISGEDSLYPVVPDADVYVYNRRYNELHLKTLAAPLAQTWDATDEIGRKYRYEHVIPRRAEDPEKRAFEDEILAISA